MQYNVRVAEVLRAISRAADVALARPLGWSQRVARVALRLAQAVGLSAEAQGDVLIAAMLHGVGAAAIASPVARALRGGERPYLERALEDEVLGWLGVSAPDASEDEATDSASTSVFPSAQAAWRRMGPLSASWLREAGLEGAARWVAPCLERRDVEAAGGGLLTCALVLTAMRDIAQRSPSETVSVSLDETAWVEALVREGALDASLSAAMCALWEDAAFWAHAALLRGAPAPAASAAAVTLPHERAPNTGDLVVASHAELVETPTQVDPNRAEAIARYTRGRHDVDEDVADIDRYIDQLLYERFGAFWAPGDPMLLRWLAVLARMGASKRALPEAHWARVEAHCRELGLVMGVDAETLRTLALACRVCSTGQLALSSATLDSPGQLSAAQRRHLRLHPRVTRSVLAPLVSLGSVVDVAVYSAAHEASSDDAPAAARILAVADVYAVLQTARPYRPAHARSRALAILRAQSGDLFDPAVVDALTDIARGVR